MDLDELISGSLQAQQTVLGIIDDIPAQDFAADSRLPGWTVAHVVSHLIGNTAAQARQLEYAADGKTIEVYSGGQEARDREIEERRSMSPAELIEALRAEHHRWEAAVDGLSEQGARAPVEYRSGTVRDVIAGRWMESLVHAVDLGRSSYTHENWDESFCKVLIDYLSERLPRDQRVQLTASDADYTTARGTGEDIQLSGRLCDIAGFLSDRSAWRLQSTGGQLAELGPYPRGAVPKP